MSTVLQRLREERGLSLRDLGLKVGVSHVTISNLEHGVSRGHPSTRAALADVMGLPIDVLLTETTNNEKTPTA